MHNYFQKISSFEINSDLLYQEWYNVAVKHDMFNRTESFVHPEKFILPYYYKLLINYPSSLNEEIDPVWIQNDESNLGHADIANFDINNIVKDFKGTQTEIVAKLCGDYIKNKFPNYRLTVVKYAALKPNSFISKHVDGKSTIPRFFLSVRALEGTYMEVCDEKHPLNDHGALFKMRCMVPHSPINQSTDYRVMMIFDVAKKNYE